MGKINFVICLEVRVYLFYKITAFFLYIQLCHLHECGWELFKILFSISSLGITLVLICTHCHFFSCSSINDQTEECSKG